MKNHEAKAVFAKAAAAHRAAGNFEKAAGVELAGEYFTNPAFAKELAAFVWKLNNPPKPTGFPAWFTGKCPAE